MGDLKHLDCGCERPFWAEIPSDALKRMYVQFVAISQQPGSQRKETQFLLNAMFSPLTNSVQRICDAAISSLYTVSSSLVPNVRALLQKLCNDLSLCDREPDPHGYIGRLTTP